VCIQYAYNDKKHQHNITARQNKQLIFDFINVFRQLNCIYWSVEYKNHTDTATVSSSRNVADRDWRPDETGTREYYAPLFIFFLKVLSGT